MDGHFVPNITIGPPVVAARSSASRRVPLDVHLMIDGPGSVHRGVRRGRRRDDLGARRGAAAPAPDGPRHQDARRARPASRSTRRRRSARSRRSRGDVDFVLVMSVNPGFGGQTFIPRSESKVARGPRAARSPPAMPRADRDRRRHRPRQRRRASSPPAPSILVAGSAIFGAGRSRAAPRAPCARPPSGTAVR